MKVVLMQNVASLGKVGEVVKVADGYARNYLFPREMAKPITKEVEHHLNSKKAADDWHYNQKVEKAEADKEKLDKLKITLSIASDKITNRTIADMVNKEFSLDIDKKKFDSSKLRAIPGEYIVKVKLLPGIVAEITVVVTE